MSTHTQVILASALMCLGIILIVVTFLTRKWQYSAIGSTLIFLGWILALIIYH